MRTRDGNLPQALTLPVWTRTDMCGGFSSLCATRAKLLAPGDGNDGDSDDGSDKENGDGDDSDKDGDDDQS